MERGKSKGGFNQSQGEALNYTGILMLFYRIINFEKISRIGSWKFWMSWIQPTSRKIVVIFSFSVCLFLFSTGWRVKFPSISCLSSFLADACLPANSSHLVLMHAVSHRVLLFYVNFESISSKTKKNMRREGIGYLFQTFSYFTTTFDQNKTSPPHRTIIQV